MSRKLAFVVLGIALCGNTAAEAQGGQQRRSGWSPKIRSQGQSQRHFKAVTLHNQRAGISERLLTKSAAARGQSTYFANKLCNTSKGSPSYGDLQAARHKIRRRADRLEIRAHRRDVHKHKRAARQASRDHRFWKRLGRALKSEGANPRLERLSNSINTHKTAARRARAYEKDALWSATNVPGFSQ